VNIVYHGHRDSIIGTREVFEKFINGLETYYGPIQEETSPEPGVVLAIFQDGVVELTNYDTGLLVAMGYTHGEFITKEAEFQDRVKLAETLTGIYLN
jgi:hypothetical protein